MLVDSQMNTSKYVSFTDLAKYVFLSGSSMNPYNDTFATKYAQSGSGSTANHLLRHSEASEYGFAFHDGVNTGNTKLCLPEEMIALNPDIIFGGANKVTNGFSLRQSGDDPIEAADKIYFYTRYRVNFSDGTYATIRFETAYIDHTNGNYWQNFNCPDVYYYDQNGTSRNEGYFTGKTPTTFSFIDVGVENGGSGTLNSYTVQNNRWMFLDFSRGSYTLTAATSASLTTGVTEMVIKQSNAAGGSASNFILTIAPNLGVEYYFTKSTPSYTLTVSPTYKGIEKGGTSSMAEYVYVTVSTTAPAWGFSETCNWLNAAKSGSTRLQFTANANTGPARTCYVTVTAGTLSQIVTVDQAGCSSDCPSDCPSDYTPTTYTAKFYKGSSSTVWTTDTGTYGESISYPTLYTRYGYTVTWPSNAPTYFYDDYDIHTVETRKNYTATFYKADSTYYSAWTGAFESTIQYPALYTKEGYTVSWPSDAPVTITGDCSITAVETQVTPDTYTATFYKADHTTVVGTFTGHSGEQIVYPAIYTKEGYTVSWPSTPTTLTGDCSIYAIESVNSYTIYYKLINTSGSTQSSTYTSITVNYGTNYTAPAPPISVPTGESFSGWTKTYQTMPASNVYESGWTIPVDYSLAWYVDGTLSGTDAYNYTDSVMIRLAPANHTAWAYSPSLLTNNKMPASNVSATTEENTPSCPPVCFCDGSDECSSDCPSDCPQDGSDTKMTLVVNYDMNGRVFSELTITVTFPQVNFSHNETCYPTSSTGTHVMQIDVGSYEGIQTTVQANSTGRVGQVYYPDEQLYVTIQGGGSTITLGNLYTYTINVSSSQ